MCALLAGPARGVAASAVRLNVVYPPPESQADQRQEFSIKTLDLALSRSGIPYTLREGTQRLPQGRAIRQVQNNGEPNVIWTVTTKEREKALLPVRIPIDKGLLGWRVLLIKSADFEQFRKVRGASGLKALRAGQGTDWPDTQILLANGLRVSTSDTYDGLFKMLAASRFDYLPRSVAEVSGEQSQFADSRLTLEPKLVLHYPTAKYFFVSKDNPALAKAIETGLRDAIRDGSFEKLFVKYHGEQIKLAKLEQRTVIELKNPLLPPQTPLLDKALWFSAPR